MHVSLVFQSPLCDFSGPSFEKKKRLMAISDCNLNIKKVHNEAEHLAADGS